MLRFLASISHGIKKYLFAEASSSPLQEVLQRHERQGAGEEVQLWAARVSVPLQHTGSPFTGKTAVNVLYTVF